LQIVTYEHCAFQERWELKYNEIIGLICNGVVNVPKLYNFNIIVVINQNTINVISGDNSKEEQSLFTKISQECNSVAKLRALPELIIKH